MSVTWLTSNPPEGPLLSAEVWAQLIRVYNNRSVGMGTAPYLIGSTAWPTGQDLVDYQDAHTPGILGHPRRIISTFLDHLYGLGGLAALSGGYIGAPPAPVSPGPHEDPRFWQNDFALARTFLDALEFLACQYHALNNDSSAGAPINYLDLGYQGEIVIGTRDYFEGTPPVLTRHDWLHRGASLKLTYNQNWPDGITPTALSLTFRHVLYPYPLVSFEVWFSHVCNAYYYTGLEHPADWVLPGWGTFDLNVTANGVSFTSTPIVSAESGGAASPGHNSISVYEADIIEMESGKVALLNADGDLVIGFDFTVSQAPVDHQFDIVPLPAGQFYRLEHNLQIDINDVHAYEELTMQYTYPYQDSEVVV